MEIQALLDPEEAPNRGDESVGGSGAKLDTPDEAHNRRGTCSAAPVVVRLTNPNWATNREAVNNGVGGSGGGQAEPQANSPGMRLTKAQIKRTRNRQSSAASRARQKIKEKKLEEDVLHGRVKNRRLSARIDLIHGQLRAQATALEKRGCLTPEIAAIQYPNLYAILATIQKAKDEEAKDHSVPEIPLKMDKY